MELDLTILFNLLKSTQDGVLNEYLDRYNGDEQLCLYHLEILCDEGYMKGVTVKESSCGFVYGTTLPRLTMKGHEMLNGLKDLKVVSVIKKKAKELGQNMTLHFVNACISSFVEKLL